MAPPPPPLTPFDEQVLALCGKPGTPVTAEGLRGLLGSSGGARVLERLGRVAAPVPGGGEGLLEALTRAWSAEDGFRHVFCGDPGPERMAGLHFRGRFLQMQAEGWGGALDPDRGVEEVSPGVVNTLGVRHCHGGAWVDTRIKSYPYGLSAAELLVEATRALQGVGSRAGRNACRHRVGASGIGGFDAVLVARDGAVVTFYPDVTPSARLRACTRR